MNDLAPPLVSVVIPAFNAAPYAAEAVESALAQTYRPIEILAVDDGSTDGTGDVLNRYSARITVIRQENRGVYRTRNAGASWAKGDFVAFLDADDVWRRDKIEKQMAAFKKFPRAVLAASRVVCVDRAGKKLPVPLEGGISGQFDSARGFYEPLLRKGNFNPLSSVVVRKAAYFALGGFYDQERLLSADYDLWIRMAEKNEFVVLSEPLAFYRVLADSLLHGSMEKEYGAQLGILVRNRSRYTEGQYERRLSKIYCDWADSAFDQQDPRAWGWWKKSVLHDWTNWYAWLLGAQMAARRWFSQGLKAVVDALMPDGTLLRRGKGNRVFLTFDDGPHPVHTEKILDVLKAEQAVGTFFVVGNQAMRHPGTVRRIVREGHEAAGHSWSHQRARAFGFRSSWEDIDRTRAAILEAGGVSTLIHRPPYGRLTVPLLIFSLLGKIKIALWSLDTDDDRSRSPETILEKGRAAKPGDILLLHDDNGAVPEALPALIWELRSRGLGFGKIGEIAGGRS